VFRAALLAAKIFAAYAIPGLSMEPIDKYVADLKLLGLIRAPAG
jgi:hypothetical protein